jgi:hypothetical protein
MGNSMGPLFLCFPLRLEKPLQAAGAATATDSIRGGKACTERHFHLDQGDCDARRPLRGGRACVGPIRNQWEARPGCEQQNRGPHYCARPHGRREVDRVQMTNPSWIPKVLTLCALPSKGAENRTRSSATLYSVVQTKVQLVDEGAGEKFLLEVEFMSGRPSPTGLDDGPPSPRRGGAPDRPKLSTGTICRTGGGKSCTIQGWRYDAVD